MCHNIYWKLLRLYLVICTLCVPSTWTMIIQDLFASPCPNTFQYKMDANGELYGTIGIYSLDENIVQLDVELSVGNNVNNYNGHIELAYPKTQVFEDIIQKRPVQYKIFFPRWEGIPPKITKIYVNGELVCSGPKIPRSAVSVLTRINLQHTLTIKVMPLQSISTSGEGNSMLNPKRPTQNPFLGTTGILNVPKPVDIDIKSQSPKETVEPTKLFNSNPFLNSLTSPSPRISTSTTTERLNINVIPLNDTKVTISSNPFLSGKTKLPASLPDVIPEFPGLSSRDTSELQEPVRVTSQRNPPFYDMCGKPVVSNPLVVHGNTVPRGSFPWLVAMFSVSDIGLEYKCSSSLVSHKHVVTAAHCVRREHTKLKASDLLFVLGKLNIQRWSMSEGEKLIEAEQIIVHPDYKPMISDADIAVVVLKEEVQFTNYIRPICLWSDNSDLATVIGEVGKIVGWGKNEDGKLVTAEPKQIMFPIVSQEQCLWSSETFKYVTSNRTFCAGSRDGTGPCNGDSGSGFIMKRNGRWMLKGVVSASTYDANKQTCDLSNYVVFTDASKYTDWILLQISIN